MSEHTFAEINVPYQTSDCWLDWFSIFNIQTSKTENAIAIYQQFLVLFGTQVNLRKLKIGLF